MTVNRADNNLARFQFACPEWWKGFCAGRAAGRELAIKESADWRAADIQREAKELVK